MPAVAGIHAAERCEGVDILGVCYHRGYHFYNWYGGCSGANQFTFIARLPAERQAPAQNTKTNTGMQQTISIARYYSRVRAGIMADTTSAASAFAYMRHFARAADDMVPVGIYVHISLGPFLTFRLVLTLFNIFVLRHFSLPPLHVTQIRDRTANSRFYANLSLAIVWREDFSIFFSRRPT